MYINDNLLTGIIPDEIVRLNIPTFEYAFNELIVFSAQLIARKSVGYLSWRSITSSSDGSKLAAVVSYGYIYTSSDSGATWIERSSYGYLNWQSITSSADGSKLAAIVSYGYIYTSSDSGVSWEEISSAGYR